MKQTPIPAVKDTWLIALKVWLAFTRRVLIALLFGAAVIGFVIKFVPEYFHLKKSVVILCSSVAGFLYFVFITIFFIKSMLNKRFKGFSVVLIKTH